MSNRTFGIGIAIVLVIIVAIGVGISAANGSHHRPEGAAEHWLAAVSDTTRKGVKSDATKRADKIGPVAIAAPLIPSDTKGKGAFPDLEVGKAVLSADRLTARVPFKLHQRDVSAAKLGTIVLTKAGSSWHVTALDARHPGEQVPSEGGAPPSSAPIGLWIAGIAAGVVLTVIASVIVEWASRSSRNALAAS